MGANRLFWPQELLDQLVIEEKVTLDGDVLSLHSQGRNFLVRQAVYFSEDVGDGSDPHSLVGRVKEVAVLEEMGAEHYHDSVLVEDSAYAVVPGFIGELTGTEQGAEKPGPSDLSNAISQQTGESEESDERELLARFLLENL